MLSGLDRRIKFFKTHSKIDRNGWKSNGSRNVRQLVISYEKREVEKENEVVKPVLNQFFY